MEKSQQQYLNHHRVFQSQIQDLSLTRTSVPDYQLAALIYGISIMPLIITYTCLQHRYLLTPATARWSLYYFSSDPLVCTNITLETSEYDLHS